MIEQLSHIIAPSILNFFLVTIFSLLIGLEQRRHYINNEESRYGTDRTFTLIGILGYILYTISPQNLIPFLCGGAAISLLLSIFYIEKIKAQQRYGITSLVTALITYCLGALIYTQPLALVLLIVVAVLVLTELKETFLKFSEKFDDKEFITLAKFLVLAGVILPLLPDKPISASIDISPFKFSLAIVAVSAISYFSYLLKKFVFPESGIVLTGILGGLYSSTATTFILARKSQDAQYADKAAPAIILATTMMYVRLFVLALFFNAAIAMQLLPSFIVFIVVSVGISIYLLKVKNKKQEVATVDTRINGHNNPLELKTAVIFGVLFIFFSFITEWVSKQYGNSGINVLSLIVGVTDIDPFIMNLFQSKGIATNPVIVMAILNAISSNNLLKMVYGITLCNKSIRPQLIAGFSILIAIGLLLSFVIHL